MKVEMSQISIPDKSIFQTQDAIRTRVSANAERTIGKIGWWSAVLTSLCSAMYGIAVVADFVAFFSNPSTSPAPGWTGIDNFLRAFQHISMLPLFPSLLLAPAFNALMVSIHSFAAEEKKIWCLLGISITLIFATMATMNYIIQLLPVWRSINHAETDGLAMFVSVNPHSIFWGLAYAYIFVNLAMLLTALVFWRKSPGKAYPVALHPERYLGRNYLCQRFCG